MGDDGVLDVPVSIDCDQALQLAHEILRHYAPDVAQIVEDACSRAIRAEFEVIGGGTPEAS